HPCRLGLEPLESRQLLNHTPVAVLPILPTVPDRPGARAALEAAPAPTQIALGDQTAAGLDGGTLQLPSDPANGSPAQNFAPDFWQDFHTGSFANSSYPSVVSFLDRIPTADMVGPVLHLFRIHVISPSIGTGGGQVPP